VAVGLLIAFPYRTTAGKRWLAVEHGQSHGISPHGWLPGSEGEVASILGNPDCTEASRAVLSLEVTCARSAPAVVRTALSQVKGLGPGRDDVILVASELVTNAVVHSGGSPANTIQVRAVLTREGVSISVQDPGLSGDTPRVRREDDVAADGWGLRIVEQLSNRWGFERAQGHRVWAELPLTRDH
jgi:anti-sigma regulatory factor (Ser/Thr protein kinase)